MLGKRKKAFTLRAYALQEKGIKEYKQRENYEKNLKFQRSSMIYMNMCQHISFIVDRMGRYTRLDSVIVNMTV